MAYQQITVKTGNYETYLYINYEITSDTTNRTWSFTPRLRFYTGKWEIGPWGNYGTTQIGSVKVVGNGKNDTNGGLPYTPGGQYITILTGNTISGTYDALGAPNKASHSIAWSWGVNSSYGGYSYPSGTVTITVPNIAASKVRFAYHPGGGTLGNTTDYKINDYGYIVSQSTGDWDFHTVSYPNKMNPRNATTNKTHFALSRTGYTFECWRQLLNGVMESTNFYQGSSYDLKLFHDRQDASKIVTNTSIVDCHLKAKWTEHTLTVNLYGNGATSGTLEGTTISNPGTSKLLTQTFYYNTQNDNGIANIRNSNSLFLRKTGYFPTGNWSTSTTLGSGYLISQNFGGTGQQIAAKVGKTLASANQSVNLYVQWSPKVITVRFNKNDGSGAGPASQSFTYGATINKFGYKTDGTEQWPPEEGSYADLYGFGQWYRNGYKIIGWSHSPSATTPDYTTYYGVDDLWIENQVGDAASKTIDLYAVWDYNGTVRIYKDGAWKMALPYVYAKIGTETSPSWHLALPYTYAQGTGETSPSWHLNGG